MELRTVESLCAAVYSGGTPSRKKPEYYEGGTIPWIKTMEIRDGYIYDSEEKITESGLQNSSAKFVPKESVLIAMYGATVGRVGYLKIDSTTNQAACALVVNSEITNPKWLYYSILATRDSLIDKANGAAQQNISVSIVRNHQIKYVPLEEQERIAGILGSLDDKIEANTRLIQTIKEYMAALYKVEAKNGKVLELTDIADFVNGRAFTKDATGTGRVVIRIAELNNGIGGSTVYNDIEVKEENTAYPGDVLMSWSGSLETYVWHLPEAIINQHIFKVIPKDNYPKWLVYHACKSVIEDFQAIAVDKATTMGHIRRGDLKRDISIPAREMPQMENLWNLWMNLEQENLQLATTRDALIKRLIGYRR